MLFNVQKISILRPLEGFTDTVQTHCGYSPGLEERGGGVSLCLQNTTVKLQDVEKRPWSLCLTTYHVFQHILVPSLQSRKQFGTE